ncbi:MAG: hypothetical protein P4L22_06040 [Candidatus Babeliales bacterium]|nr:hypothetical protein [Candidatus Babeliales bacterium]
MLKQLIIIASLFNVCMPYGLIENLEPQLEIKFYFANRNDCQLFNDYVVDLNLPLFDRVFEYDQDGDEVVVYNLARDLSEDESNLIQRILNGFQY